MGVFEQGGLKEFGLQNFFYCPLSTKVSTTLKRMVMLKDGSHFTFWDTSSNNPIRTMSIKNEILPIIVSQLSKEPFILVGR